MCRKKEGFTLMELLVVIAVVIVLAGFLMPALAKTRQLAHRARCANNLKQIGTAMHLYANNNNGDFPAEPWGSNLYPSYIDDEEVFDCPTHGYVGTTAAPDYWYVVGLNDYNTTSNTVIAGCYDGCHDGLENKLYVDGRVAAE